MTKLLLFVAIFLVLPALIFRLALVRPRRFRIPALILFALFEFSLWSDGPDRGQEIKLGWWPQIFFQTVVLLAICVTWIIMSRTRKSKNPR